MTGFADDYAFLIRALLDLNEASGDSTLIPMAVGLQDTLDARFWNAENARMEPIFRPWQMTPYWCL